MRCHTHICHSSPVWSVLLVRVWPGQPPADRPPSCIDRHTVRTPHHHAASCRPLPARHRHERRRATGPSRDGNESKTNLTLWYEPRSTRTLDLTHGWRKKINSRLKNFRWQTPRRSNACILALFIHIGLGSLDYKDYMPNLWAQAMQRPRNALRWTRRARTHSPGDPVVSTFWATDSSRENRSPVLVLVRDYMSHPNN
jgi:hypothetical protein